MAKDYNPDIVSVVDEEGKEHIFEELDRIETDRGCYVALLPVYDDSEEVLEGEDEVLPLKVIEEDGETFEQNALKKAQEVLKIADADAALSDDSGLMVDALDGAPGVYSARFAGEGHDDAANNAKLMDMMRLVPEEKRTARFVSAVALARRGKEPMVCRGAVEGSILYAPQGENGFGYDPLFFYAPAGLSFAQMSAENKNAISHRKRALEALKAALEAEKRA